jgi:hypothetical protein
MSNLPTQDVSPAIRYRIGDDGTPIEDPTGEWVKHDDLVRLAKVAARGINTIVDIAKGFVHERHGAVKETLDRNRDKRFVGHELGSAVEHGKNPTA